MDKGNWLLAIINGVTFILALWIIVESGLTLSKKKKVNKQVSE